MKRIVSRVDELDVLRERLGEIGEILNDAGTSLGKLTDSQFLERRDKIIELFVKMAGAVTKFD